MTEFGRLWKSYRYICVWISLTKGLVSPRLEGTGHVCVCGGGSAVLGTGQASVGRDGVQRSTCEPSEQQPENI